MTGLEKVAGPPTREGIVNAFEGLGQFDLGLGEPLSTTPGNTRRVTASGRRSCTNGAFVPFDWKDIAGLVKGAAVQ